MENWTAQINEITQDFVAAFGALGDEALNWTPNSQTWSIAQNMEHLIVTNQSYFPNIEAIRKGTYKTPFLAKLGFVVAFFEKMILNAVQPDRRRKMTTFPIWEPSASEVPGVILDRFQAHQSELINVIEESGDLVEKGVVISSPANKNIVYRLEKAFEIIVTHEKRHFEQSREILALMKASAGE